jgi:hypothetical protein
MEPQSTCGQGLAHHASFPARLADVFSAIADNLETHITALDPTDKPSRPEFDAYVALATEHREIELRLRALSLQMERYRDLPMAAHDTAVMTSPKTDETFERLVQQEEALAALLQDRIGQHRALPKTR